MAFRFTNPIIPLILLPVLLSCRSTGKTTDAYLYLLNTEIPCLNRTSGPSETFSMQNVNIQNDGLLLRGQLYLPISEGTHPAVLILHGGSTRYEGHRQTARFFAQQFARCGIATLTYDKRGTGDSGGVYESSSFDDLIADAGSAVRFLAENPDINPDQIGILGLSQGGKFAPVVAARYGDVDFLVGVSAPHTRADETIIHTVESINRKNGIADSLIAAARPFWERHFEAHAAGDSAALLDLDHEILSADSAFRNILPSTTEHVFDWKDIIPNYRSLSSDYTSELSALSIPWFSIYGQYDDAVPVEASIRIIRKSARRRDRSNMDICVVPNSDHMFRDLDTGQRHAFEKLVIGWTLQHLNLWQPE